MEKTESWVHLVTPRDHTDTSPTKVWSYQSPLGSGLEPFSSNRSPAAPLLWDRIWTLEGSWVLRLQHHHTFSAAGPSDLFFDEPFRQVSQPALRIHKYIEGNLHRWKFPGLQVKKYFNELLTKTDWLFRATWEDNIMMVHTLKSVRTASESCLMKISSTARIVGLRIKPAITA